MVVFIPLTMDGVYRLVDLMVLCTGAIWMLSISETKPIPRSAWIVNVYVHNQVYSYLSCPPENSE